MLGERHLKTRAENSGSRALALSKSELLHSCAVISPECLELGQGASSSRELVSMLPYNLPTPYNVGFTIALSACLKNCNSRVESVQRCSKSVLRCYFGSELDDESVMSCARGSTRKSASRHQTGAPSAVVAVARAAAVSRSSTTPAR